MLRNPFFVLVAACSLLFVMTILAFVATMFSDPASPVVQFIDRQGITLIAGEVVAILLTGMLAMVVDRRQTLRQRQLSADAGDATPSSGPSSAPQASESTGS